MKGYKGFEPGLICKGKQYAENTVFEEENAVICNSGMHFCENPFDVLDHYDLVNTDGEFNDFAEVEAIDEAKTEEKNRWIPKLVKTEFVDGEKIKADTWYKLVDGEFVEVDNG